MRMRKSVIPAFDEWVIFCGTVVKPVDSAGHAPKCKLALAFQMDPNINLKPGRIRLKDKCDLGYFKLINRLVDLLALTISRPHQRAHGRGRQRKRTIS